MDIIGTEDLGEQGPCILHTPESSLIKEVPSEILQEIFVHCLTADRTPSRRVAPLLLCHVCSMWRKIALATPELWNVLQLREALPLPDPVSLPDTIATIRTFANATALWFDSIGRHPISFSVVAKTLAVAHTMRNFVLPIHPQIRVLDLEMVDDFQLVNYDHFQHQGHMPFLESVRITMSDWYYESSSYLSHRYPSFEPAARLRRLALDIPNMRLNTAVLSFPWAQLTHLIIARPLSVYTWHEICRQCPQLQELTAELSPILPHGMWDSASTTGPTSFSHLRDLTLLFVETIPLEAVFGRLSFPALEVLHLGCEDENIYIQNTPEPLLLLSSYTQLTELTLRQADITTDELMVILRTTIHLTSLEIDCNIDVELLLSKLYHDPDQPDNVPPIVPRLQDLTLGVREDRISGWSDMSNRLLETVQSRWWPVTDAAESATSMTAAHGVSSLRYVSLAIDSAIVEDEEALEPFRPFKAQGLGIFFRSVNSMDWGAWNSHHLWLRWTSWQEDE